MESISFSTGGFKIKFQSESSNLLTLEQGVLPFVIRGDCPNADVVIQAEKDFPDLNTNEKDILFEASNGPLKFFSIYKYNDALKFLVYDQSTDNKIQQIAFLDKDFTKWTVYSNSTDTSEKIFPLKYPLGPLVLYYLTLKQDAVIIHSSGIFDGIKGRLFTGFSGTGKSTMASLWYKAGSNIINDDRIIIRCENEKVYMYNTPMFYADIPKKVLLDSVHIIRHAPVNSHKKIEGVAAVSKILAFCIQHNYNPSYIEHHLNVVSKICQRIAVFEVGFKPDCSIVDYLKEYAN